MAKPDYTLIFIVEDDFSYAKVIRHALEKKNYLNIKVFYSGEDCLQNMHLKPDVVLLDYRLGENKKDGMDVLRIIKKNHPFTEVVFLTAIDNLEVATQTIKEGAYDYVVKSEAVMERTRNILRRIIFEKHIQNENRLLRRSQKIIIGLIAFLILCIAFLIFLQINY